MVQTNVADTPVAQIKAGETAGADEPDGPVELGCTESEVLGGKICAAASLAAQSECQLLELIGEFDAGNAVRWWDGVKSLAHWLSWACSMSPGTAREHVRVARALPQMPTIAAAFRDGRLSYSKVREVSRVADLVDETELCELALTATAAQLAKMISGYRTAAGTRIKQERLRGLTWTERESGIVDVRVRLPKEEAAVLLAALNAAKDQNADENRATSENQLDLEGQLTSDKCQSAEPTTADTQEATADTQEGSLTTSPAQADTTPAYNLADAMLDVARLYLNTAPEDRSGEDRSLVVVHVNAELLGGDSTATGRAEPTCEEAEAPSQGVENVPAGTSESQSTDPAKQSPDPADQTRDPENPASPEPTCEPAGLGQPGKNVPAGTPTSQPGETTHGDQTCHIDSLGGIEPETARKLSCDTDLLGAIIDSSGNVLALGRTRRLVSRAQRRALMIRDHGICQFTGCHQTHHLQAHHIIHWADGGPTDLDNLVLLCSRHHTVVHEGGMIIRRVDRQWEFLMPDGSPHKYWWSAEGLLNFLAQHADKAQAEQQRRQRTSVIDNVVSFHHPHAQRIQPGWRGERFDLHECVQSLFRMPVREDVAKAA